MPSPRRSNGYQQQPQHSYGGNGNSGGYYNSNHRYDYGAYGNNSRHEENDIGYKRSRSSYEGGPGGGGYYSNNHGSSFPSEPSYYDSNKKFRRDWYAIFKNKHPYIYI